MGIRVNPPNPRLKYQNIKEKIESGVSLIYGICYFTKNAGDR